MTRSSPTLGAVDALIDASRRFSVPVCHHCSPTGSSTFLRPRRFTRNRAGEKALRSTVLARPSKITSAINFPLNGPQRMPQQLCPAEMNALL